MVPSPAGLVPVPLGLSPVVPSLPEGGGVVVLAGLVPASDVPAGVPAGVAPSGAVAGVAGFSAGGGVVVPAGVSAISLTYRPRGISWGLPLAALGMLGLALLARKR